MKMSHKRSEVTPEVPVLALQHQQSRRRRFAAAVLILFLAVSAQAGPARGASQSSSPPGARDINIFDQNLYVGSDFTSVLNLDPTDPNYGFKLVMGVAAIYQQIVEADFPARAEAIAEEIEAAQPDLVSLQEVSLIRMQIPGDSIAGGTTPATEVQLDYLGILLANLNQHGTRYAAVAIVTNAEFEMPMPTTTPGVFADVRLTDHDVILARVDRPRGHLRIRNAQCGNYQAALALPIVGASFTRGWCAVDVTTRGRTFRFINTHLEENTSPAIQAAQAQELLAGPANTTLPVILVGDLNSDAYGNDGTTTYDLLTDSFTDAWSVLHPDLPGFTWGHDPLLADSAVPFIWRIDLILFRGSRFQPTDMWALSPQIQATPPLWVSDHAAVMARFRIK